MSTKKRTAHNSTLPAPTKELRRKTPLRSSSKPLGRNAARGRKRWHEAFGEKSAWIRSLSCAVGEGCSGKIECAHVRSRGAGGDSADTVPLCMRHHREQHDTGILTFQAKYALDLHALASRLEALWQSMDRREVA